MQIQPVPRQVDAKYLETFVRQALRAPNGERDSDADELVKRLAAKCKEHAVFFEDQLKGLAHLGQLSDTLECVVVANLITEHFDSEVSEERKKKPLRSFFFALAGSLQAMEAMCVNYGVCSALVLTMTFANFGVVVKDDWDAFMINIMMDSRDCWSLSTCPEGSDKLVCLRAVHLVADEPWTNLSTQAPPLDCCNAVVECGKDSLFYTDLAFTTGNGAGSACLLLVVLFSSWLYIAIYATKANRGRWEEVRKLTKRMSGEFFLLQVTFLIGIVFAGCGIGAVMTIKVTTEAMSWLTWIVAFAMMSFLFFMLVKIIWEILMINRFVDKTRKKRLSASLAPRTLDPVETTEVSRIEEINGVQ
jgi:hypothetical protein